MKRLIILTLSTTILLNSNAQTKKVQPIKKGILSNNLFKTLKDSASYAIGINIAKSIQSQKLGNINTSLLTSGISDIYGKKKLLLNENNCMQIVQDFVAKAGKADNTKKPNVILSNLTDSASYAIGINVAQTLKMQNISSIDTKLMQKGLDDVFKNNKTQFSDADCNVILSKYVSKESAKKSEPLKAAGKKFMLENAKRPEVKTMPEGWQYEVLKSSDSKEFPLPTDKVKCHYKGTLIDGTVFDESYGRGEPIVFPLNGVIKGWTLALQKMNVGSKWKIYLPSDLGYGDNGTGDKIGPGATLIFEVELLGIEK